MSPLRNLKKRVKTDMDISLIELLLHVSFDYTGKSGCHTNFMMKLQLCFKNEYYIALAFGSDNCAICS